MRRWYRENMAAVSYDRALTAQQLLIDQVGSIEAVNGVGIAPVANGYELKVNIVDPAAQSHVPREVDGVTVRVRTVGRLRKR